MSKISKDNTAVRLVELPHPNPTCSVCPVLELHGNRIAAADWRGQLWVTLAGWPTVTTRSRLNALPGVHVHQHKGKQYLNGEPWDGSWTSISSGEQHA